MKYQRYQPKPRSSSKAGAGTTTRNDQLIGAASTVLQGVTYDPATVTAAIVGINNAVAHQDLSLI
jgi:hypothetical protein